MKKIFYIFVCYFFIVTFAFAEEAKSEIQYDIRIEHLTIPNVSSCEIENEIKSHIAFLVEYSPYKKGTVKIKDGIFHIKTNNIIGLIRGTVRWDMTSESSLIDGNKETKKQEILRLPNYFLGSGDEAIFYFFDADFFMTDRNNKDNESDSISIIVKAPEMSIISQDDIVSKVEE